MAAFETRNFINGDYVDSVSQERLTIRSAYDDSLVTSDVQVAGQAEIDSAVQAAENTYYGTWGTFTGVQRGSLLFKLADLIERDAAELARLEVLGSNMSYQIVAQRHVPATVATFRHFAGWADKLEGSTFEDKDGVYKLVRREPYGVVAGLASYNATFIYVAYKIGQAIAAGNCVIFKASEKSPLGAIALGKLVKEAGFPSGVVQFVNGGGTTGELLASHMRISLISFTGSNRAGKKIAEAAAKSNLKKVLLELGGKNPGIVFDDADMATALAVSTFGHFHMLGQACTTATRILVQSTVVEKFTAALAAAFEQFEGSLGRDPRDKSTVVGPLVDKAHFDSVLDYINAASKNGTLVVGGAKFDGQGLYVRPTIIKDTPADSISYREESFGPVVVIKPFENEEEAIKMANDTDYGLSANIYTENLDRALRVSSAIEAGIVTINMPAYGLPVAPFGGFKQSGHSPEGGRLGIEEYTRVKTILVAKKSQAP